MKSRLQRRIVLVFLTIFILTLACSMPTGPATTESENLPQTQAAATLDRLMTDVAKQDTVLTPTIPAQTHTSQAITPAASSTLQATQTVVALPSITPTQVCDAGIFVSDITIPDGSTFSAGIQFTKTWRIKNTGTCTWTPEYAVVFDSGDAMDGPAAQTIGTSVTPGQTIDVSITLRAPGQPGTFRGYYKMRNAAGVIFGLGSGSEKFYVEIKVISSTPSVGSLDFDATVCQAEWTGNDKTLACLGRDGDEDGFVLTKDTPVLETGYVDDETALITFPPRKNDSMIRGKYPVYTVSNGDHFTSIIGCEHNAKNCNVRFQLDYQVDNGAIQTMSSWNESYDDSYTKVDVDLSSLAGKNVRFILTVLSLGSPDGDRAQWLAPQIR